MVSLEKVICPYCGKEMVPIIRRGTNDTYYGFYYCWSGCDCHSARVANLPSADSALEAANFAARNARANAFAKCAELENKIHNQRLQLQRLQKEND